MPYLTYRPIYGLRKAVLASGNAAYAYMTDSSYSLISGSAVGALL